MKAATVSPPPPPPDLSRRILPGIAAIVALFDACFYDRKALPGLATAIFFAGVALTVWLARTTAQVGCRGRALLFLLAGCVVEAVIETGFSNALLFLTLTPALAAETWFVGRPPGLDRWSAQVRAFILAPFRAARLGLTVTGEWILQAGLAGRIGALLVISVPTVVLLLIFGGLLSSANAVFGLWMGQAFNWIGTWFPDLSLVRMLLWLVVAVVAVSVVWPSEAPDRTWNWKARLARWPQIAPARLAVTASGVMLVALNSLFAVANVADALFLWNGGKLPTGVNYSEFVHEGVELLILTVLLSALVLASIFNQPADVAGRRGLKALGGIWIAQNLFLVLSTARRLELYIQAYDASVARLSILIFLILVTVGFGLLVVMIGREKPLAWLVGRAALAAFATIYLAQFLNLGGWVAQYNVAHWEANRSRKLDLGYLADLGPAAWPALARAEKDGAADRTGRKGGVWDNVRDAEDTHPHTRVDHGYWREFSLRAWWNRDALK